MMSEIALHSQGEHYQVLARKHRPLTFGDLRGQEVLVKTLTNGLKTGRLPHAFVLTGIRGVGKTTTARLLARALNCTGRPLDQSVDPCGACGPCQAILQDRFIDVIEMDAASRTGIDDVREVIDAARYKPVVGQFKVYIIDEVHMLSKSAFNGLLKTLEEPPAHVKFIFATTEIRKIPKTVLSRCMRFDLSRIAVSEIESHLHHIAAQEGYTLDARAALLLAHAADGSARDGLSLLDQALTLSQGTVSAALVEEMLGLGPQGDILALWRAAAEGAASDALAVAQTLYNKGAEPLALLHDLLDLTYTLTRTKVSPEQINTLGLSPAEHALYSTLRDQLTYPTLTRLWQMYLKGLEEVQGAHNAYQAFQMILIRVAYVSTLPTPEEALRHGGVPETRPTVTPAPSAAPEPLTSLAEAQPDLPAVASPQPPQITCFEDIVALARAQREALLQTYLHQDVRVVQFTPGHIILNLPAGMPEDFTRRLSHKLNEWTGQPWHIEKSQAPGAQSLKAQEDQKRADLITDLSQTPLAQEVSQTFPGAQAVDVQPLNP